ncbi:MAG: PqqD family peptide modification chaperone [Paracoccaceae bacterium]
MTWEDVRDGDLPLRRADGVLDADLHGETLMMSVEQGAYFAIAGAGTRIWSALAEPRRPSEIVAVLLAEYDVSPERCRSEAWGFLETLLARRLIEPAEK